MSLIDLVAAGFARLTAAINAVDAKTGNGGAGALGVHAKEPGLVSGSYLSQQINASAFSTIAAAANRLDLFPFIPSREIVIDELAVEVTTLIAASQAKIGIYASDANGNPAALIAGSGNLDCSTTGAKTAAVGPLTLNAGTIYWLAIHSSSTQTYRGIPVAALQPLGHNATLNTSYTIRRATPAFAGGLPANAPATTLTSAIAPWMRMRID